MSPGFGTPRSPSQCQVGAIKRLLAAIDQRGQLVAIGAGGDPLTVVSLEASFDVYPGGYNEWRVQGSEIEGVFVADPNHIFVKCEVEVGEGEWKTKTNGQRAITMNEVFATFPDSRIFTMNSQGKVEISRP